MKALLFVGCLWLVVGPFNAQAQAEPEPIDLAKFTCRDYLQALEATPQHAQMQSLTVWLDGYLSGISGNTEFNWREIAQYRLDLAGYCRSHAGSTLQEAARKAGM